MHGPIQPAIAVMDFAQLHMAGFPALSFAKGHTHGSRHTTVILPPFAFLFPQFFRQTTILYEVRTYIRRTSPKLQELSRYVYNSFSFFFTRVFFTTKKVSSVNEKWLPFDSCPLKSRLLWYFAWHTTTDCCRGLCRVARGGSELGEKAPF